jgi:hypothetical protein
LLETHPLPEGLVQRLEVEGRIILLKPQAKLVEVDPPQVMAFGGGEWQPFRWTLERPQAGTAGARTVVIEGKPDGTLSVVRSGAAQ